MVARVVSWQGVGKKVRRELELVDVTYFVEKKLQLMIVRLSVGLITSFGCLYDNPISSRPKPIQSFKVFLSSWYCRRFTASYSKL